MAHFLVVDIEAYNKTDAAEVGFEDRRLGAGYDAQIEFRVSRNIPVLDIGDLAGPID